MSHPKVTTPSVGQHPTGFGIGNANPSLSWRFEITDDTPKDWAQSAYELEVERTSTATGQVEDAQKYNVDSGDSVLVPWPVEPLQSRQQARVRVQVRGKESQTTGDWSPWTTVETGLLERSDWKARPITSVDRHLSPDNSDGPLRPLRFRRVFDVPKTQSLQRARLYITSLGVYKAYINGEPVGDHEMAPGWTSYKHRLNYQVFDVASLLKPGQSNVIAVEVAEGWYAGRLGFLGGRRYLYGDVLGLLAQLEIGYSEEKDTFTLVTDASWSCKPSAIVRSEIYDGEVYDAREEESGWNSSVDSKTQDWQSVKELPFPSSELIAPEAPPVRIIEEVHPKEFITTPAGKTVVDFGQNLVGRLRVQPVAKPAGHAVQFKHAEVLENGELGVRPLRVAKCTDTFISASAEEQQKQQKTWSPAFTFHGFRYVEVDGWTREQAENADITALVMHTDLQRTGHFQCSHPLINKLHENAWWSMRGNFLSIPTDCPQRDERLGWAGDIQVFAPSASYLCNTAGMLGDWLQDLQAEQLLDNKGKPGTEGIPPFVVPNVISEELWPVVPQAVWDDVTVLLPWTLYSYFGDVSVLARQYDSMLAWLDQGVRRGPDRLWDPELWQLGDWLDPTAPPEEPGDARTSGVLVADAYLVHVTDVMAKICGVLDKKDDAARFASDAASLRKTFQKKYIAPSGLLVGDTQTALSLALVFGLHADPVQAQVAADRLVQLVRFAKFRVATGFAGTPIVTHALTKSGHHQVAYRMLQEGERPSWMYPIRMGATTVWERWDSMLPDGSINPGEMTSFNHYALGSVINWLHSTVAGVQLQDPGWKRFRVRPLPGGTVTSAETSYETPYGRLEVRWKVENGDDFQLEVLVPANCQAQVVLPHEKDEDGAAGKAAGKVVGSGRYVFASKWDSTAEWPPKALVPPMRLEQPDTFV